MKGLIFTFGNKQKAIRLPQLKERGFDMKRLLSRYGVQAVFGALFLMGLVVGALSGRSFSTDTLSKLDLLFVTNIDARMKMSFFDIFVSCFVSYFLFLFCVFLSALSAWGFTAVPVLSALKGFTVGLSSAFIFALYQLSGVGFYILVVLPGTVLFLFVFIRYSTLGFRMSLQYFRLTALGSEREPVLSQQLRVFLKKTMFALLSVGLCAVIDMALWVLFANKFDFG